MQFILRKTGWLSAIALSLVFISLWTIMALSAPGRQHNQQLSEQKQATYSLALPTIMAPVIRKEVRKEVSGEVQYQANISGKLPAIFKVIVAFP
jgi:hypothetical protein